MSNSASSAADISRISSTFSTFSSSNRPVSPRILHAPVATSSRQLPRILNTSPRRSRDRESMLKSTSSGSQLIIESPLPQWPQGSTSPRIVGGMYGFGIQISDQAPYVVERVVELMDENDRVLVGTVARGDQLLSVDGELISGMTSDQINERMFGPFGTIAVLEFGSLSTDSSSLPTSNSHNIFLRIQAKRHFPIHVCKNWQLEEDRDRTTGKADSFRHSSNRPSPPVSSFPSLPSPNVVLPRTMNLSPHMLSCTTSVAGPLLSIVQDENRIQPSERSTLQDEERNFAYPIGPSGLPPSISSVAGVAGAAGAGTFNAWMEFDDGIVSDYSYDASAVYREEDGFSLLRDSGIIQVSMLPGEGDENEEENFLNTEVIIDDIPAPFHPRRKMSFTSETHDQSEGVDSAVSDESCASLPSVSAASTPRTSAATTPRFSGTNTPARPVSGASGTDVRGIHDFTRYWGDGAVTPGGSQLDPSCPTTPLGYVCSQQKAKSSRTAPRRTAERQETDGSKIENSRIHIVPPDIGLSERPTALRDSSTEMRMSLPGPLYRTIGDLQCADSYSPRFFVDSPTIGLPISPCEEAGRGVGRAAFLGVGGLCMSEKRGEHALGRDVDGLRSRRLEEICQLYTLIFDAKQRTSSTANSDVHIVINDIEQHVRKLEDTFVQFEAKTKITIDNLQLQLVHRDPQTESSIRDRTIFTSPLKDDLTSAVPSSFLEAQKEADVPHQQLATKGAVRSLLAALHRSEGADEKRLLEVQDPVPILKAPGTCVVIDVVERAEIPATRRHKEIFEFILNPNAKFKAGDIVLGKHEDHGEQLFSGMVMAPLATLFKEVDADGDGKKLSYDEWWNRLGHLVTGEELRKLFDECDKDKNGALDLEEFTHGFASKYQIKWAQEPQTDGIKDAKDICLAPDPDLFRQEVASQKKAKERQLAQQKAFCRTSSDVFDQLTSLQHQLADLRIDRDKAQKEADALRQQLAPNGPVRSRIESLIDAVRKLTEERDRLLAFPAPKHQPVLARCTSEESAMLICERSKNLLQSKECEIAELGDRECILQEEISDIRLREAELKADAVRAQQEILDLHESEKTILRLHQDDMRRLQTTIKELQEQLQHQQQSAAEEAERQRKEVGQLVSKCGAYEKETKMLKFYMSTLPLPKTEK